MLCSMFVYMCYTELLLMFVCSVYLCLYMWCAYVYMCVSVCCVFIYICTYMCYAYFSLHVSTVYEMNVFCGFMHKYIVYVGMFYMCMWDMCMYMQVCDMYTHM